MRPGLAEPAGICRISVIHLLPVTVQPGRGPSDTFVRAYVQDCVRGPVRVNFILDRREEIV